MDASVASPPAFSRAPSRVIRTDRLPPLVPDWNPRTTSLLLGVVIAVAFVVCGVDALDLGSIESRLGLAAGERMGPLGQIYGYWTSDVWPAQLAPSVFLAQWHVGGRPSTADIRWPAAVAGLLIGGLLARTMYRRADAIASVLLAACWFGTIGLMDRSAGLGIDLILGLGTIATVNRLLTRGSDWGAGAWASLAFLAGGWPPLAVIGLTVIVIGKTHAGFSWRLLVPPCVTAILWSIATLASASAETWAAALTLPLVQRPSWFLAPGVLFLTLPWGPAALLAASPSVRANWNDETRAWTVGWIQAAIAATIAGTMVPGLSEPGRMLALAGLTVTSAAVIRVAWSRKMAPRPQGGFLAILGVTLALWLAVMLYGLYVWTMAMPYYRFVGVIIAIVATGAAALGCSAVATANTRRGVVTLIVLAVGLKIAYWGYYAPEWNYRLGQGPWGRAIGQWVPRKWPVYTFHPWPTELAFAMERPVRQLNSPSFLAIQEGQQSRYVLLTPAEFDDWPDHAMPIRVVARFQDPSGLEQRERILARTAGTLPAPGQKVPAKD